MEALHATIGTYRLPLVQGRLLGKAHTTHRAWRRKAYAALLVACSALERRTASEGHPVERVERALTFLLGLAQTGPKPWSGPVEVDTFRTRTAPAPGWTVEHVQSVDRVAIALMLHNAEIWRCQVNTGRAIHTVFGLDLESGDWDTIANGLVATLIPHRAANRAEDARAFETLLRTLG